MRNVQHNAQYEMAYGHDHIFGLFIQIFDRKRANDDDEGIVVDLDQMRHGLTMHRIAEIAEEYSFHVELPEGTIT
jgi:hypothetical protein